MYNLAGVVFWFWFCVLFCSCNGIVHVFQKEKKDIANVLFLQWNCPCASKRRKDVANVLVVVND